MQDFYRYIWDKYTDDYTPAASGLYSYSICIWYDFDM